jgi:hypothetical protein
MPWYPYNMRILAAAPLPNFRLDLSFDNGEHGVVDLSDLAGRGVFTTWQHPGVFEKALVTTEGAVEWPGEIDLCPDALYLRMTGKAADEVFPALKNRHSHA